jgi:diaminohydroxyphosphoribosylaminopyrimidine deaminase/5-amino-6-(5-phosphoribosylamino)uracil reductase
MSNNLMSNNSMASFSAFDAEMMARALRLAERGLYLARPNPRVGCVITQNDQVVGEGYHQVFGQAHAEVNALKQAGSKARGGTAYVTLEPCAHQGKTGPCAAALINAGVNRVVCAMRDPNPKVDGGGFAMLQQAGISVDSGLMAQQAADLNPGFIKRMQQQRPLVRLKMAISADGRTAMASGESQWITGPDARQDVQRLRARHDAIITGRGTLVNDNPSLNVRLDEWAEPLTEQQLAHFKQPVRVLIDRQAKANLTQQFFKLTSPIWWVGDKDYLDRLPPHIERKKVVGNGADFFNNLLKQCAAHQFNEVLIEAGSKLAGQFIQAGLVDELVLYIAPKLMGANAMPLAALPFDAMEQSVSMQLTDCRQVGDDLKLTYQLSN